MKKKTKQRAKHPVTRKTKTAKKRKLTAKRKNFMSNDTTQNQSQSSTARAAERPTGALQVSRTELVWPGKYNDDGTRREVPRVSLPFQVIETVNESQATRQAKKASGPTLFDLYEGNEGDTFDSGWQNKLIWGDNLLVMGSLLERFAGKIDLIYTDPPFATGADFSYTTNIGDAEIEVQKEQSVLEEKAYRDTWGRGTDSYLSMMYDRLVIFRDLLSPKGSIFGKRPVNHTFPRAVPFPETRHPFQESERWQAGSGGETRPRNGSGGGWCGDGYAADCRSGSFATASRSRSHRSTPGGGS